MICTGSDLATGVGEHDCGRSLTGRVGERKSDQDHRAYWRWDHASSSSGRFRSSASAASLNSALSEACSRGPSSRMVTSARRAVRGGEPARGAPRLPCSSMTASTVLIHVVPVCRVRSAHTMHQRRTQRHVGRFVGRTGPGPRGRGTTGFRRCRHVRFIPRLSRTTNWRTGQRPTVTRSGV